LDEDASSLFGTKVEIFSMDKDEEEEEERRNSTQVNATVAKDSNLVEEENKKMYTALLQNQVLGIDNPFLLHEIHNSDDIVAKQSLYSQMQRTSSLDDDRLSSREAVRPVLLSGSG
jgi:hypothetical protein